jgi:hypothetical protein
LLNEGLPVRHLAEGVIDELVLIKQQSSQILYLPWAYLITNASDDFILVHWIFSFRQATAKKKARATEKSQADKVEEDSEDKENGNVAPAKRRRVETYELHCYLVNYTIDQRRLGVLRSTHVLSKSSCNLSNGIAYIIRGALSKI